MGIITTIIIIIAKDLPLNLEMELARHQSITAIYKDSLIPKKYKEKINIIKNWYKQMNFYSMMSIKHQE